MHLHVGRSTWLSRCCCIRYFYILHCDTLPCPHLVTIHILCPQFPTFESVRFATVRALVIILGQVNEVGGCGAIVLLLLFAVGADTAAYTAWLFIRKQSSIVYL